MESVGIPVDTKTERAQERMSACFLAVANVTDDWSKASDSMRLKTRDIIAIVNERFGENISSGSYDDIRRKDLKLLTVGTLIVNSGDDLSLATNAPTRGYSLHPEFRNLITHYGTKQWKTVLAEFNKNKPSLSEALARKRDIEQIPVSLPGDVMLKLSSGEHNILQKDIVEQFLPRFGNDCEVLYLGDTAKKLLHINEDALQQLKIFKLSHDELPDVIAYSKSKNWLFLIEAVHSAGTMSEIRVFGLKNLLKECPAELIFVTAFLNRDTFKKWSADIAWETEVWLAENPDHLIHFNGNKFLGA